MASRGRPLWSSSAWMCPPCLRRSPVSAIEKRSRSSILKVTERILPPLLQPAFSIISTKEPLFMKPEDEQKESNILFVGIDLGTSRSAISSSNGKQEWIESYVGWPKDFIAEQVVGKPVLFGAEALQHRLSLDICRPLERGIIKEGIESNERAVKEIIRHLIDLAKPGPAQKIHAVVGVPADSLKVN